MGNHGSKRKARRQKLQLNHGPIEDDQIQTAEIDEATPDAYDKLMVWMSQMAENDEQDVSSPIFVENLKTVCADKQKQNTNLFHSSISSVRQNSSEVPIRQNSFDSSTSSRLSRSSGLKENLSNPKTRFRRSMLCRQSTIDYSDESDAPNYTAGMRSFDSDLGTNVVNPDTRSINGINETSFTKQFRPPLRKNQSCTTYRNYNASIANLLNVGSRKKSKSLMTMKKMMSETRNDEEITPIIEDNVPNVLDDDMLDRNMADILYSVEALWPNTHKYLSQDQ